MKAVIKKIVHLCTKKVKFYTIHFDGKELSEFKEFYEKLSKNEKNKEELDNIFQILTEIGNRGVNKRYFNRTEDNAYALPHHEKQYFIETEDYGIRLYCLLLNDNIVILLNGDRKKTMTAKDEKSNVSKYFRQANSLYDAIMEDKLNQFIAWGDNGLNYPNDYYVEIKG